MLDLVINAEFNFQLPTPEAKDAPEEEIEDLFETNSNSIEMPIESDSDSSDSDGEEHIDEPSTSQVRTTLIVQ